MAVTPVKPMTVEAAKENLSTMPVRNFVSKQLNDSVKKAATLLTSNNNKKC